MSALALGLVIAEVAARALGQPPPVYLPHPYLRRVRAPGSSHELLDPWTRQPFVLHVDWHYTARGCQVVADKIMEALLREGRLPGR